MGKFHDALSQFGVSLELPDEFRSAIESAYDEDFSGADAKVVGLETSLSEKDSDMEKMRTDYETQLSAAKAANWDLLRSGGNISTEGSEQVFDDESDEEIHNRTVSDLFG